MLAKNLDLMGMKMTKVEFLNLFWEVWLKAVTADTVKAGFRNTGIWPADTDVLKMKRLAASQILPKGPCELLQNCVVSNLFSCGHT